MSRKEVPIERIADAMRMELLPNDGTGMSVGDLDWLIEAREQKFGEMFALVQSNEDGQWVKSAFPKMAGKTTSFGKRRIKRR